jgi:hypothetical protein
MGDARKMRPIADKAPRTDYVTDYDRAHFSLYARLLDAAADGASDDEIAQIVLAIDPQSEPGYAKRVLDSHMHRARWMSEHGFKHLLARARLN